MSALSLERILEATGYLPDGQPAVGLYVGADAHAQRRGRDFVPDALWRSPSSLTVYFKYETKHPDDEEVSHWRREVWNEGFAPLLWVISPERIDLYNGFGAPVEQGDAQKHLIRRFEAIESSLAQLDAVAGRLAIETGQFWVQEPRVDRKTSVDQKLLSDLALLEHDLTAEQLARDASQALIGRVIFTQYLLDRQIVSKAKLRQLGGYNSLPEILRNRQATEQLFEWLSDTFNGDMFPPSSVRRTPAARHLSRVADFLEAVDPESGQKTLFPYQFDVIPVELISSIYEQFAHSVPADGHNGRRTEALQNGVHYTRLSVVSLVLDEVMDGLEGHESVLDLTCGSGVFLVEALRRLVFRRANGQPLTRELIRSTLYKQIYGVDISEAAVRVAAFSLYLAALELDPNPQPPRSLKFQPLIGHTLLIGDARTVEHSTDGQKVLVTPEGLKQFDLIVGNPPWSFRGKEGTQRRRTTRKPGTPAQPRGEGLDFVHRAAEFSHKATRFGVILSATPFFSRSGTGMAAAQHLMRSLAPITLVNLSNLCSWLFATATMPAVVLFARHRPQRPNQVTVVQIPWTESSARTHSFEVAPSDILTLSLSEIEQQPIKLKAAAVGRRRDLMLLEHLTSERLTVSDHLAKWDTKLCDGLTKGSVANQTRDASDMLGLPLLESAALKQHFLLPRILPVFQQKKAQWPRSRGTYKAPLLLIKEMVVGMPRPLVAVSSRDMVYTDAYFAAPLPKKRFGEGLLLSAILSSAMSSWFFGLTASEFGIYKRKLLMRDVACLPIPDLEQAISSDVGERIIKIVTSRDGDQGPDWPVLDEAVFDLYGLDEADRVVVRDGLVRASWQWEEGRLHSAMPAHSRVEVASYAKTFISVMAGWLSARNQRHMRAEVFDLSDDASLRVVRFVLEDGAGEGHVQFEPVHGQLGEVLQSIGSKLNVKVATALSVDRELRIHGRNEVVVIKPAARRYWMGISALEDADAVVAESFGRGRQ